MVRLCDVAADLDRERDGVWVHYSQGIELKIARLRTPEYRRAVNKAMKARRERPFEDADDAVAMLAPLIARYILKDWRNISDAEGKERKYTVDEGTRELLDPRNIDLYEFIVSKANEAALFEQEQLEDAEKN